MDTPQPDERLIAALEAEDGVPVSAGARVGHKLEAQRREAGDAAKGAPNTGDQEQAD